MTVERYPANVGETFGDYIARWKHKLSDCEFEVRLPPSAVAVDLTAVGFENTRAGGDVVLLQNAEGALTPHGTVESCGVRWVWEL